MDIYHKSNLIKQRGFSLLELMIGLALGVFVVGGIYTVLVGNTNAYTKVKSNSILHEDARLGMAYLRQQFQLIGWRNANDVQTAMTSDPVFFPDFTLSAPAYSFEEHQVLAGKDGASIYESDEIVIRYKGSSDINNNHFNCQGNVVGEDDDATVRFFVNSNNQLMCSDLATATSVDVLILENVESLKIQYFIKKSLNRFVNAAYAANYRNTTEPPYFHVSGLRFALVFTGEKKASSNYAQNFKVLGEDYSKNDRNYREVFQETVLLYNEEYNKD